MPFTLMLKTTSFSTSTKTSLKALGNSNFLTPETKLAFLQLRQAFTKALIFYYFDLKSYNRIKTNAFGYTIGGILSQLTSGSGQWQPIAFFSRKIIPAEI